VVLLAQEFHLVFDAVPVVVDGCQGLTVGGRDGEQGVGWGVVMWRRNAGAGSPFNTIIYW
jgi:hypothetical protein